MLELMKRPNETVKEAKCTSGRIFALTETLVSKMTMAIEEISEINDYTHILSLNARIEAARAGGQTGAAFGVIAQAIKELAAKSSSIAARMSGETQDLILDLQHTNAIWATNVRGERLSDLALTNIGLIDRNLYERSCDVRWWATDSSPVEALTTGASEALRDCSRRFGIILKSYTVYYDLVLCDLDGKVIANGRPEQYRSVGMDCSSAPWFLAAQATRTGEEFGFQGMHASPLVNSERILIYSCAVRAKGDPNGRILGVLGILFNWDALAQTIVDETPLPAEERGNTRVCIVDEAGRIIADTADRRNSDRLNIPELNGLNLETKAFCMARVEGRESCVAVALSPGYETYATGWRSVIIQYVG